MEYRVQNMLFHLVEVKDAGMISEIFDAISYYKVFLGSECSYLFVSIYFSQVMPLHLSYIVCHSPKGSSVIRMLNNYLAADDENAFRDGLRSYFKAKQYACATTEVKISIFSWCMDCSR